MTSLSSPLGSRGWYEANPKLLSEYIQKIFEKNEIIESEKTTVSAMICPHAGYYFCGQVLGAAMSTIINQSIEHVIILGPSHYHYLPNQVFIPSTDKLITEIGESQSNQSLLSDISKLNFCQKNDDYFVNEHSIWMMLPFIQYSHPSAQISPILVGDVSKNEIKDIAAIVKPHLNQNTLLLISSDFTHYGESFNYTPFSDNIQENIKKIDHKALDFIMQKNANGFWDWYHQNSTTICGRYSISVLLECLSEDDTLIQHNYFQSSELNNDWSQSVSYFGMVFGQH